VTTICIGTELYVNLGDGCGFIKIGEEFDVFAVMLVCVRAADEFSFVDELFAGQDIALAIRGFFRALFFGTAVNCGSFVGTSSTEIDSFMN
jgi:hypothetical protein